MELMNHKKDVCLHVCIRPRWDVREWEFLLEIPSKLKNILNIKFLFGDNLICLLCAKSIRVIAVSNFNRFFQSRDYEYL